MRIGLALLVAAGLLVCPAARAADEDPWTGPDKTAHFVVSAGIAAGGYALGTAHGGSRSSALAFGAGLAVAAGIAKETADLAGLGHASWKDLAWDGLGMVTGLIIASAVEAVDLLVRGKSGHFAF